MTEQLAQQMTPGSDATEARDRDTQATQDQDLEVRHDDEDLQVQDRQETDTGAPLFESEQEQDLRRKWSEVQSQFVDDPRAAVQQADALVADVVRSLVEGFADRRSALEQEWDRDEQPDTEQLRVVFQRYRSFFTRLLAA